jgi:hypothetical protein
MTDGNESALKQAEDSYEAAEAAYLSGIASGSDRDALRQLARTVSEAASVWERAFFDVETPEGIVRYYDAPEALRELWQDICSAYDGRTL